jgi:hypothetical protein
MNIPYFASGTSNVKENLVQYFYWKIARLSPLRKVFGLNIGKKSKKSV